MILFLAGILLFAAGFFSGFALTVAPLGLVALSAGPALWVLFPLLCFFGYGLSIVGVGASAGRLSFVLSSSLLALAAAAAIALVGTAAGLIERVLDTSSIWYVFAIAGALGTLGVAARSRRRMTSAA